MLPKISEIGRKRKALNLTQKDLALRSNVSQSLIAKIESGNVNPSYDIVKRIFQVFSSIEKDMNIRASDILSKPVVSINRGEKVEKAIDLMKKHNYSQLPVVDKGYVVGTISEKTILEIISTGKALSDILNKKSESVMTSCLPRITEDENIDVISTLLRNNPAVLVTRKGKTVGIISKADLFKIADKR